MASDFHYSAVPLEQFVLYKYTLIGTTVAVVYEYCITVDLEVERIWQRPMTQFTVLWVLVRYLPIFFALFMNIFAFGVAATSATCPGWVIVSPAIATTVIVVMQLVVIVQVYALWGRSKRALVFLLCCLTGEAAVLYWIVSHHAPANITPHDLPVYLQGCLTSVSGNTRQGRKFGLINCVAILSFHSAVLGATLWRTWEYRRSRMKAPIVGLMLRQGLFYFGVILVTYMITMILLLTEEGQLSVMGSGFNFVIPILVINRLVLNMRAFNDNAMTEHVEHAEILTAPGFTNFSDMITEGVGPGESTGVELKDLESGTMSAVDSRSPTEEDERH